MRIGILGGSFDPIHYGHLAAAEEARSALQLTRVLLIPAARHPRKAEAYGAAASDRLAMARLACAGEPAFEASPIEVERAGRSYTVDTLEQLHKTEAGELYVVLGADAALGLPRWRAAERILDLARVVVVGRPGAPFDAAALAQQLPGLEARLTLLEGPRLAISSGELRERIAAGRSIRYLAPDAVIAYIAANRLYQP